MIETLFEFCLNIVDYSYMLYFYALLIEEKRSNKVYAVAVLLISIIQFLKDNLISLGGFSSFIDCFVVVIALFMYAKRKDFQNFLCAIIMYSIMKFSIVCFVAVAIELSIDVSSTLVFGYSRLWFCMALKLFTLLLLYMFISPMKQLRGIISYGELKLFSFVLIVSLTCLSYVYGNSNGNEQIFIFTAFLSVILVLVYYLFYSYCKVSKKYVESQMMNKMMDMTKEQVAVINNEYEHYRKIKHDINNHLTVLYDLQKQGLHEEVLSVLSKLCDNLETSRVVATGNILLDAVLRLKQKQFSNVNFKLELIASNEYPMEGNDFLSLLSNIIDNACEGLQKVNEKDFVLTIKVNKTRLQLYALNKMRAEVTLNTNKDPKSHGLGLKIINEIVVKYDGMININTGEYFEIKVLIV